MATSLRTSLVFDDPGELIAAIPGMLSFVPSDSLVLITYTGSRRLSLSSVVRLDLPLAEHYADLVTQLRVVVGNHGATAVELVVLGGGGADPPDGAGLPHRDLIVRLAEALDQDGVVPEHAVWAPRVDKGVTWWCYHDPTCTGQIRDPATSPVTTAMTVAGAVTFASREDLAQLVAHDPDDALARRAELLEGRPPADPERGYALVRDAVDAFGADTNPTLDDEAVADLAHALSTDEVREACLAFCLTARARAAERLWLVLTRAAPGRTRAEPASLLAACAYLRGEGVLAALAVDAAHSANAHHNLTHTIRHALDCGIPPDQFRLLLAQSFVAAFADAPDPDP
jgi:hypothetical protein